MFDLPPKYIESYLEAWREQFTGFELQWIEVEICRRAMVPKVVGDLFESLKKDYQMLQEWHHSKFYRIVSNLEESGYLESSVEGRTKIISTSIKGARELGRITRYFIEIQFEHIRKELWIDLIYKITPIIGCLLDQKLVVMGPEYHVVPVIAKECRLCPPRNETPLPKSPLEGMKDIIFLDANADLRGKETESTIISAEVDDWPLKENYADVVLLVSTIGVFPEKQKAILSEAVRVVKNGGKLVLFELTRNTSRIVLRFLTEAALLVNIAHPTKEWKIPDTLPTIEEITELIAKVDKIKLLKSIPDVINTVFIIEKN